MISFFFELSRFEIIRIASVKKQKCFVFNLDVICVSRNLYNKINTKFLRKIKLQI